MCQGYHTHTVWCKDATAPLHLLQVIVALAAKKCSKPLHLGCRSSYITHPRNTWCKPANYSVARIWTSVGTSPAARSPYADRLALGMHPLRCARCPHLWDSCLSGARTIRGRNKEFTTASATSVLWPERHPPYLWGWMVSPGIPAVVSCWNWDNYSLEHHFSHLQRGGLQWTLQRTTVQCSVATV